MVTANIQDLAYLLQTQQWSAIDQRLAGRNLTSAHELQALALLLIHKEKGHVPWPKVVETLARAVEREPENLEIASNLAQALIDSGDHISGLHHLRRIEFSAPTHPRLQERIVYSEYKSGHWDAALQAFRNLNCDTVACQMASPEVRNIGNQLQSLWWRPLRIGSTVLRSCRASDTEFLNRFFGDSEFMHLYHRLSGAPEARAQNLIDSSHRSPYESRELHWVIENSQGRPTALVSFVDFNWASERAELLVGSIEKSSRVTLLAVSASLYFALYKLRLKKIVSLVYGENAFAQRQTIEMGFRNEGYLRSHISHQGRRSDVFVNGMTQEDFESSSLMSRLVGKYLKGVVE